MLDSKIENLTSQLKLIGLLAPTVLAMNCIGILLCLIVLYNINSGINERSGQAMLQQIKADFEEFEPIDRATRGSSMRVRELETGLETELSEMGVVDMTNTIIASEQNAQLFLRLLKVNVYNLAGLIPGTASWYEIYAPVIEAAIERSRSRQVQLLAIKQFYESAA